MDPDPLGGLEGKDDPKDTVRFVWAEAEVGSRNDGGDLRFVVGLVLKSKHIGTSDP